MFVEPNQKYTCSIVRSLLFDIHNIRWDWIGLYKLFVHCTRYRFVPNSALLFHVYYVFPLPHELYCVSNNKVENRQLAENYV